MPRLVRRAPLQDRIRNYIWDTLLWLSEEFNAEEWADTQKEWALPVGLALNFVFMIARANTATESQGSYDVFGDFEIGRGSGWLRWLCSLTVSILVAASCLNAFYTFTRKRHYRLFEASVDVAPSTPSARRVRVDSSPSSSPLRFLSNIVSSTTAESRAHPDSAHDVWELAVWDPTPICLRLFCLFSPGHVLMYCMFLPVAPLDPRPSVTVVITILLAALLSVQLHWLQANFSQQAKDQAVISKEVLHEYDTKFVHPSLNKPVRDVGIQTPESRDSGVREVDVYTPTTIINRGFRTNPNPAYAQYYDRDNDLVKDQHYQTQQPLRLGATPPLRTPMNGYSVGNPASVSSSAGPDYSSPIRQRAGATPYYRQSSLQKSTGDGGSLGIYTHAASPLRKTASANYLRKDQTEDQTDVRRRKEGSPLKRVSMPSDMGSRRSTGVQGPRDPPGDINRQSRYF